MKAQAISPIMILMVVSLVTGLLLFAAWYNLVYYGLAPICWKNTMSDLDEITGTGQFSRLLGKDIFFAPLRVTDECADSIYFGNNYNQCLQRCREYGDLDQCLKECRRCGDKTQNCIVAVPKKLNKFTEPFKVLKSDDEVGYIQRNLLANFGSFRVYKTDYEFSGAVEFLPPEKGSQDICLKFTRSGNVYTIVPQPGVKREACINE
jgi:hypothetical protein